MELAYYLVIGGANGRHMLWESLPTMRRRPSKATLIRIRHLVTQLTRPRPMFKTSLGWFCQMISGKTGGSGETRLGDRLVRRI